MQLQEMGAPAGVFKSCLPRMSPQRIGCLSFQLNSLFHQPIAVDWRAIMANSDREIRIALVLSMFTIDVLTLPLASWVQPAVANLQYVWSLCSESCVECYYWKQFINKASESNLPVGRGLESCTGEVRTSRPFIVSGRVVTLIDTPGFDDTTRSDTDVLTMIAAYLSKTYVVPSQYIASG
jgi:hypothetical protein